MSESHADPTAQRLAHVFRERAISVRTMDRPLRVLLGLALLQLGVAAMLIALRDAPMGTVPVFTHEDEGTAMGTPILWASVALAVLAWTYLLAGALAARPALRLVALGLFTAALYPAWEAIGHDGVWAAALLAAVAAIWAVGLIAGRRERRPVAVFALLLALVALVYLALWAGGRGDGGMHAFTLAFSLQLATVSLALIPVLTLAGVDFAEWGDLAAGRAAALAARLGVPAAPALLTAAVAAAILVLALRDLGADAARELPLAAGAALALALVARGAGVSRAWPAHVPLAAVAVVAVSFFGLFYVLGTRAADAPPTGEKEAAGPVYRHAAEPPFSLAYPPGWRVGATRLGGVSLTTFRPPADGPRLLFLVAGLGAGRAGDEGSALHDWLAQTAPSYTVATGEPHRDGAWLEQEISLGPELGGVGWTRVVDGRVWLVYGLAQKALLPTATPLFARLAAGWSAEAEPAHGAAEAPGSGDRLLGWAGLVWAAVTAAAAAALVAAGRRAPGPLHAAGLFLVVTGLLFVLGSLRDVGVILRVPHALPTLHLTGVQALVAAATLVWLALPRGRASLPTVGALLTLNGGLEVLALMFDLYTRGLEARLSVAQACVILLALLWDVVVSGETFTNGDGRLLPRHARILLFLGYVMLVSTAVLFFSSLHVEGTNANVEPQFESELWPQLGLVLLGMPLLLSLFALRLARRPAEAPAAVAAVAVAE